MPTLFEPSKELENLKYCVYLPLVFKAGEITANTAYNAGTYSDGVTDSLICLGLGIVGYGLLKLRDR